MYVRREPARAVQIGVPRAAAVDLADLERHFHNWCIHRTVISDTQVCPTLQARHQVISMLLWWRDADIDESSGLDRGLSNRAIFCVRSTSDFSLEVKTKTSITLSF